MILGPPHVCPRCGQKYPFTEAHCPHCYRTVSSAHGVSISVWFARGFIVLLWATVVMGAITGFFRGNGISNDPVAYIGVLVVCLLLSSPILYSQLYWADLFDFDEVPDGIFLGIVVIGFVGAICYTVIGIALLFGLAVVPDWLWSCVNWLPSVLADLLY